MRDIFEKTGRKASAPARRMGWLPGRGLMSILAMIACAITLGACDGGCSGLTSTPCGGDVVLAPESSDIAKAAAEVAERFPNINSAQASNDPSYVDAHPAGALATGHAELVGYGVTFIQGTRSHPVHDASGALDDPTLLFFEKQGGAEKTWEIIGMGYTFDFKKGPPPDDISVFPPGVWWIHEAGYHHAPGDGGFTCAVNDDIKTSAEADGVRIDAAGCLDVDDEDLKTHAFDVKHGRFWTVHVWFDPDSGRPVIAKTDPWCRQSDKALSVPSCAFFKQGTCD